MRGQDRVHARCREEKLKKKGGGENAQKGLRGGGKQMTHAQWAGMTVVLPLRLRFLLSCHSHCVEMRTPVVEHKQVATAGTTSSMALTRFSCALL